MSLAQAIRGAMSGGTKPVMQADDPDDDEVIEDGKPEGEAEGETPDDDAEGGTPEEETEGDGPDDDQMSAADRRAFARGRRAERTRMAAILGDKAAEANPTLAAHLAFNTAMSAGDATAALEAGGAPKAHGRLRDRVAASDGQTPLGNGGKTGADAPSSSDRRAAARAGYLTGLSNRKRKEG